MKILLSCTNHLARYLKADLPRLPTPAGEQAGVRSLQSGSACIAFQCHVVQIGPQRRGEQYLLAIEANSRYCMVLPLPLRFHQEEIAARLQSLYLMHVGFHLFARELITEAELPLIDQMFAELSPHVEWVKNTDRSLQGSLTQLQFMLEDVIATAGKRGVTDDVLFYASLQFNDTQTSRTISAEEAARSAADNKLKTHDKERKAGCKERFFPTERFAADCMLRFGPIYTKQQQPDNVVDLAAYRALRAR